MVDQATLTASLLDMQREDAQMRAAIEAGKRLELTIGFAVSARTGEPQDDPYAKDVARVRYHHCQI